MMDWSEVLDPFNMLQNTPCYNLMAVLGYNLARGFVEMRGQCGGAELLSV